MQKSNIKSLFYPKSIAIVGVSKDPTKLGSIILSNLVDSKYKGNIYPVNPKYDQIFQYKCYKKISEIPEEVDVVCIAIPAKYIKDVIIDANKNNAKNAVIISAGFKETGEKGQKLEKEIINEAQKNNMRILGPNCLGLISPFAGMNLSFAASTPTQGNVGFLSQSGAFCTAILDMSLEKEFGFSHFVSLGNKTDIDENDIIKFWLKEPKVKVMSAYIEEINDGQKLMRLMNNSKKNKPLIVFKPGKTQEAKKAIASHTGSLAGSIQTAQTAMKQTGIIEATEINHMFYLMMGFAWSHLPEGTRVAIVTNAGGPGIMATDEIIQSGLKLAKLSKTAKEKMKKYLPATASVNNPIDVIGDALAERYKAPIEVLLHEENVDAIIVILTPQLVTQIEDTAKLIINSAKLSSKPILPVFLGGKYVNYGLQRLYDNQIPGFKYIGDAVKVLKDMYFYKKFLDKKQKKDNKSFSNINKYLMKGKYQDQIEKLYNKAIKNNQVNALPEDLVEKIVKEVNIVLPSQIIAKSLKQAFKFAKDKFPVVAKATSEVIAHKTDDKALYLNIQSKQELEYAFNNLHNLLKNKFHQKNPEILIQEQIDSKLEFFIGANRDGDKYVYDPQNGSSGFGHLLAFGQGGIYTEIYKDIAYSLVPTNKFDILSSLQNTKVYEILKGARGQEKLPIDKIIQMILSVQKLVLLYPQIISIDINPMLLTSSKAVAVDVKLFIG